MVGQYSVSGGPLKGPGGPNGPPVCYLKYALVQTGTEKWYRKPMRGFNFAPIQPDLMLIFLNGDRYLPIKV